MNHQHIPLQGPLGVVQHVPVHGGQLIFADLRHVPPQLSAGSLLGRRRGGLFFALHRRRSLLAHRLAVGRRPVFRPRGVVPGGRVRWGDGGGLRGWRRCLPHRGRSLLHGGNGRGLPADWSRPGGGLPGRALLQAGQPGGQGGNVAAQALVAQPHQAQLRVRAAVGAQGQGGQGALELGGHVDEPGGAHRLGQAVHHPGVKAA